MKGSVAEFLPFYGNSDKAAAKLETSVASLKTEFLNDPNNAKFRTVFDSVKTGILINIHTCPLAGVYLVMIKGAHDGLLIKLGHSYKFPRGFPVLWIPKMGIVRYFGFLPKFSNDDRQVADNLSDYKNVESIRFFKKWSGFLGQLLVFEINDRRYYTVCSKNSASYESEFVKNAKNLFAPFVTPSLVDVMIANKYHICAEMMSFEDQTHGARVLKESPVVTVIGSPSNQQNAFVDFMNHTEVVSFCVRHGLPCDSAITISGESTTIEFLQKLFEQRDFMDDTRLDRLVTSLGVSEKSANSSNHFVTIDKGTVCHSEILGNRLEGLVFSIKYKDGTTLTKKYKFPAYTIRTMLFRPAIEDFHFGLQLKSKITKFVDFWCVSEIGRQYWYHVALEGFMMLHNGFASKCHIPEGNEKVGTHIILCDYLEKNITKSDPEIAAEFDALAGTKTGGTVVIVVGPIGSGKTTVAGAFCKAVPGTVNIDGDDLGLGYDTTMNLKAERNVYSLWKITEALMEGKIPVISAGGGIFVSNRGDKFILRDTIYKTLGINVKIIVLVPDARREVGIEEFQLKLRDTEVHDDDPMQINLTAVYDRLDLVRAVVKQRVESKLWFIPGQSENGLRQFADLIAGKSKQNQKFASILMTECDLCYTFPVIKTETYAEQVKSLIFSQIVPSIVGVVEPFPTAKFTQVRVLTEVVTNAGARICIGHITMHFDETRSKAFTLAELKAMIPPPGALKYERVTRGLKYDLESTEKSKATATSVKTAKSAKSAKDSQAKASDKKPISIVVPVVPLHTDSRTHITINPGVHEPKEMIHVAKAIYQKEKLVTLPGVKSAPEKTYSIDLQKSSPCLLNYLDVFGI